MKRIMFLVMIVFSLFNGVNFSALAKDLTFPYTKDIGDEIFVSTSGSNTNGNGTRNNPYQTIQFGIEKANNGQIVTILPGNYRGEGNVNISTLGKTITIQSETGPINTIIDCNFNGRAFIVNQGEKLTTKIKGIQIINGKTNQPPLGYGSGIFVADNEGLSVNDCIFINNQEGCIQLGDREQSSPESVIENCAFIQNIGGCTLGSKVSFSVESCFFYGNEAELFGNGHVSDPPHYYQNSIFKCNKSESALSGLNHGKYLKNSIFIENTSKLGTIYLGTNWSGLNTIENCTFYNNKNNYFNSDWWDHKGQVISSIIYPGKGRDHISGNQSLINFYNSLGDSIFDNGNIQGNPMFKDPKNYDFSLAAGSPCIGTGANGTNMGADPSKIRPWLFDFLTYYSNEFPCETSPPPPCELPKEGLVGYWPFCGNADDKSGNGNHGTVNGATLTEDRFGRPNQAYNFDGVDDYIKGNFNNFPIGNEARSITSWIKINKDTTLFQNFIIAWGTANSVNTGFGVHIYEWLDNIGVWLHNGNSKELIGYTFMPNKYYFLGLTIDQNQNALIYVDGKLLLNFNLNGMNTDINNEFYIGKSTHFKVDQWAGYFSGVLDDIAIWDRALSEEEIQQVYKMECDVCDIKPEKEYFKVIEVGDCNESKLYLTVNNSKQYDTFEWNTGSNTDTILIDKIGSYTVKIRNKNGQIIEMDTLITEINTTLKYNQFTNFQNDDFVKNGDFRVLQEGIILTDNKSMQKGAFWHNKKLNVSKDFKVSFGFRVYKGFNNYMFEQSYPGADGFAFVLQNHEANPIGESGGGIGYSGIPNSLAIELDLFGNYLNLDSIYDPNGNHLAIFSNKEKPNSPRHKTDALIIEKNDILEVLGDSSIYYFNIEYKASDKTLKTAISKTEFDYSAPIILNNFEFRDYIKLDNDEFTYFGVTSSTGTAMQVHEITNLNICGQTALINTSVESAENELLIYPNPVINELNINLQEDSKSIIIYDLLGNIIFEDYNLEINKSSYKIDTIEFPKGTYILEIKTDKKIMTSKFIKI